MLSESQFKLATGISAALTKKWYEPVTKTFAEYFTYTPLRMANYLAQVGHESMYFKRTEESFAYSAERLRAVFPSYFTLAQAQQYARKPQAIADRVYGGRMGNRPEGSGDGWANRGRGLIMVTGADNYEAASNGLGIEINKLKELLVNDPDTAARASAWWLWNNKATKHMDTTNIWALSRLINFGNPNAKGTPNGMNDRQKLFNLAYKVLV